MSQPLAWIFSGIIAYCLGSISFGILVAHFSKGPDLRSVGSKNTGATNVLRTMGWKYGLITFLGDALKAVLACWIGQWLSGGNHYCVMLCGLMVIAGHNWPVFFGFKGGKGVASSCGVMIFCFPAAAGICFALTVLIIVISRYVSLGSICMLILYAVIVSCFYAGGDWIIILWTVLLALLCLYRHRANISRLLSGKENRFNPKVGWKKKNTP